MQLIIWRKLCIVSRLATHAFFPIIWHSCQLSRIERETHAFPHRLTQFLKKLIFHAISRIFDFWKNFPRFPTFWQKSFPDFPIFGKNVSPISRFSEKSFPDFPIFGKSFPVFRFWKSEKSDNRAKISDFDSKFLSHAKSILGWTLQNFPFNFWKPN